MNSDSKKKAPKIRSARALLLFSGGLDSILAAKVLAGQGIDVTGLAFSSYFFNSNQAKMSAKEIGLKLLTADFSREHLKIVRKPRFGRGTGINPCVDCHLLMLKEAEKVIKEKNFDFLATGEVVGQRPLSQNREALKLIERKAGLAGKVLRPLSAKLLWETEMEKVRLIGREKLYGFSGRGRKGQIKLAKEYGIEKYPSPAGGCILTDRKYSKKLGELFEKEKRIRPSDIELLRIGRHFWSGRSRIIVGRNKKENEGIKKIARKGDMIVEPKNFPGPTALVRGKSKQARQRQRDKK